MFTRIRKALDSRRRSRIAGCCGCGNGAVRYVYASPIDGQIFPDEARCSRCGPLLLDEPIIDYGQDRFVTVGQMDDDVAAVAS